MYSPVSRITDYESLQTAIKDFLDRTDLDTQVPMFIQACESECNRVLRVRRMLKKGQSVGWRTSEFIPLPDDFLEARTVEIVFGTPSATDPEVLVDGDKFQATYQPPGTLSQMAQGNPQFRPKDNQYHYAFYETVIEIFPAPPEGTFYRLDIEYYSAIPGLGTQKFNTDPIQTNWLLEAHPDVYLYGSLKHSAPFLRDDERIALWSKLYTDAMRQLMEASDNALTRGSRLTKKVGVSF